MKAYVWGVVTVIVLLVVGGIIFVWSGIYNMAADVPHYKVTFWLLDEARERSVAFHSKDMAPPSLQGQNLIEVGLPHFHEMCRLCHGAPGFPAGSLRKVYTPARRHLFPMMCSGV